MIVESINIPKISIVIPVYNGEKYLYETLNSILNSSFNEFEIICVDDCSSDDSLSIIKCFENKYSKIKVISTESNQGIVPLVLNIALPYIKGEYFFYSSQDDLFSKDLLENLFNRAIETGADAVIPDLVFYKINEKKEKSLIGLNGNRNITLSNREAVVLSLNWNIPGNALWNVSIIKKIGYFTYGMNADEFSVRIFYFQCNKIVFSKGIFYYRQNNYLSITKKLSIKSFDNVYTEVLLYYFLKDNDFGEKYYLGSLSRAYLSLIDNKARLIDYNRKSSIIINGAEDRIKLDYLLLKDKMFFNCLDKQKGFIYFIIKIFYGSNYKIFSFLCFLFFIYKKINKR